MASKRFGKGTPEREMFQDFWRLCQGYWVIEDNGGYWDQAKKAANSFYEKNKATDMVFAREIAIAFIETLNKKHRKSQRQEAGRHI